MVLVCVLVGCGGEREEKAPPEPAPAPAPTPTPPVAAAADAAPLPDREMTPDELMGRSKENLTATKATCDPASSPTRAWAYQQYLARGGEEHAHPYVRFHQTGVAAGLWLLALEGGPDQPSEHKLAYVFGCRLHDRGPKLDQAILLAQGWKGADGAARTELAARLDDGWNDVVKEQPEDWDARRAFTAPAAKPTRGGGVELTRWIAERRVVSYSTGESESSYLQQRVTYSASGVPSAPKTLAKIKRAPGSGRGKLPL